MLTSSHVVPDLSDSDPRLAQLALDLCLDDELAARYRESPALVLAERDLAERDLAEFADGSLIDNEDLLSNPGRTLRAITWCFSTPDGDQLLPVA